MFHETTTKNNLLSQKFNNCRRLLKSKVEIVLLSFTTELLTTSIHLVNEVLDPPTNSLNR